MYYLLDDPKLKDLNGGMVDEFVADAWRTAMIFTYPVEKVEMDEDMMQLRAKFEPWVSSEEERLKKDLEEIHYNLDDPATVTLITGPGRIEMVSANVDVFFIVVISSQFSLSFFLVAGRNYHY